MPTGTVCQTRPNGSVRKPARAGEQLAGEMLAARRSLVWILAAFFLPRSLNGVDYEPISLECLIGAADTIAVGRVTQDRLGKLWVAIEETLAGKKMSGRLRLRVSPWQGPPARPPGRALLFLRRTQEPSVEVLGPSAEGWLPIERSRVRIDGVVMPGRQHEPLIGPEQRHELAPLLSALRWTGKCVRWRRDTQPGRVEATIICGESAHESMARGSAFARKLLNSLTSHREFPCLAAGGAPGR